MDESIYRPNTTQLNLQQLTPRELVQAKEEKIRLQNEWDFDQTWLVSNQKLHSPTCGSKSGRVYRLNHIHPRWCQPLLLREMKENAKAGCGFCAFLDALYTSNPLRNNNSRNENTTEIKYRVMIDYQVTCPLKVYFGAKMGVPEQSFTVYESHDDTPTVPTPLSLCGSFHHIQKHAASTECLQLAKKWLEDCCTNHTDCGRTVPSVLPSRILEIPEDPQRYPIKLVEQRGRELNYVALSHCWGQAPTLTTKAARLEEFKHRGIAWISLSKTFQDAVTVCKAIGINHLWIDSLCIIQDSTHDWDIESARMGDVYEGATLVIAATCSPGDDRGFLWQRPDRFVQSFPLVHNGATSNVYVAPWLDHKTYENAPHNPGHDPEPLFRRGWTVQERLLARRFLSFDRGELRWECNWGWRCECGFGDYLTHSPYAHSRSYNLNHKLKHADPTSAYDWWYFNFVPNYTYRLLTKWSDRLPAISALAKAFQGIVRDDYLAGIWRSTLLQGLRWSSLSQLFVIGSQRGPSWSWASVDSAIRYIHPVDMELDFGLELIDAVCTPSSEDPTGIVAEGQITLRSQTFHATVRIPRTITTFNRMPPILHTTQVKKGTFRGTIALDSILDRVELGPQGQDQGQVRFTAQRAHRENASEQIDRTKPKEATIFTRHRRVDIEVLCLLVAKSHYHHRTEDKFHRDFLVLGESSAFPGRYVRLGYLTASDMLGDDAMDMETRTVTIV